MNSSKETQGSHPTSAGKPKGKKTKPKSNTKQRQSDSRGKGKNKNSKAVKKGTPVTPKPKNKPVRAKPRGKSRTGSDVHAKTPKPGEGFLLHRNKDKFAWSKFQNSPGNIDDFNCRLEPFKTKTLFCRSQVTPYAKLLKPVKYKR